jgi:hypothetical protein
MSGRSALLINCSEKQAGRVRETAQEQRRTISGYVLYVLMRAISVEERFFARVSRLGPLPFKRPAGPRTCLLIRCSQEEAQRVRRVAKRREMSISAYVLYCLERSWNVGRPAPRQFSDETAPAQNRER